MGFTGQHAEFPSGMEEFFPCHMALLVTGTTAQAQHFNLSQPQVVLKVKAAGLGGIQGRPQGSPLGARPVRQPEVPEDRRGFPHHVALLVSADFHTRLVLLVRQSLAHYIKRKARLLCRKPNSGPRACCSCLKVVCETPGEVAGFLQAHWESPGQRGDDCAVSLTPHAELLLVGGLGALLFCHAHLGGKANGGGHRGLPQVPFSEALQCSTKAKLRRAGRLAGEAQCVLWLGALLTLLGSVFTVDDPGQAEVCDFAAQGLRHQDVGRPQVSVDGIHVLDVRHPLGDLRRQAPR